MTIRRAQESPRRLFQTLAGTSTAQQVATVRKYSWKMSVPRTAPWASAVHRVVVMAASTAASTSEPHNSAAWPRSDGAGSAVGIISGRDADFFRAGDEARAWKGA